MLEICTELSAQCTAYGRFDHDFDCGMQVDPRDINCGLLPSIAVCPCTCTWGFRAHIHLILIPKLTYHFVII